MTDRQELAHALAMCDDYDGCFERVDEWEATPEDERRDVEYPASDYEDCQWWLRRADVVLAAGWRKPREITTIEELEALPTGTVVLDGGRHSYQKSHISGWTGCDATTVYRDGDLLELPVTVLWEPQ